MKQKIYILGVVTVLIIFLGTIFKVNHWPGAGWMLTIGIAALVLLFLPLAVINHYKAHGNKQNLLLHIATWLTGFVVFTSMLFKVQHWPYAGVLLTVGLIFPYVVFLPVFIITISKNKNFNIYNTVFVLFLLAVNSVFSALLALNVSRAMLHDSFNISRHYNSVEKVLNQFPANDTKPGVIQKIDDVLKVVGEYKDLILTAERTSTREWENNARDLYRPDSRDAAVDVLLTTGYARPGDKLDISMKALIKEAENTPGCEDLAKSLPAILDLRIKDQDIPSLVHHNVTNIMTWTVIYLDGVETNLKLIKTTL
jgi:hypothetical protein